MQPGAPPRGVQARSISWTQHAPYNHLSTEQVTPFTGTYPGSFRLLASGNAIYGLVQIDAGEARRYDGVEVAFVLEGATAILTAPVGKDFAASASPRRARAVWSKDGRTLELEVELSDGQGLGAQMSKKAIDTAALRLP